MKTRRADMIAAQLEELIFNGTYANGAHLDEVRLAEQFGVSRTPLREALQRLAQTGLIELIPGRGAFIRQFGPVELLEMFEAMAELEAICGRLAAIRITDEALEELNHIDNQCQNAVEQNDIDEYYHHNERFHRIIYQHSGNHYLEGEALQLQKRLRPFRHQQLRLRGRMKQSLQEHQEIMQALKRGDTEKTAAALRSHVAIQGEAFHHLMARLKEAAE